MINGIIRNANKVYQRTVKVNPIAHHYEEPGEKPYIKYSCPVCTAVGNIAQIAHGIENCPLCGVSLNWDRKPEVGDEVVICDTNPPDFIIGDKYVIIEDHSDDPCELPYVIERNGKRLRCKTEFFTILDEPEE